MDKTIWKFEFTEQVNNEIEMPKNAEILTLQTQYGNVCMWALVDPNEVKEMRSFDIFGTGHNIDMRIKRKHIGTYQVSLGTFVFHVFERV